MGRTREELDDLDATDPAAWRTVSGDLLDGDLVWIPIRHHSPACAHHVERIIADRQPYAVLVEGPRTFNHLIPLLVHPAAAYPLAIYAHVTQRAGEAVIRNGSYYPLCDYSPELVALQAASRLGAVARFIDADHQYLCGLQRSADRQTFHHDDHYGFSAALEAAAARAGCRDHNDLWDQLFETNARDAAEFVAGVNTYGLLARSTAEPGSADRDGTTAREAVMANEIRQVVAERDRDGSSRPIVVVTGAFHTSALRDRLASLDGPDRAAEPKVEVADHGAHLIRYSFDRLDALNGYASGMPSPAWYQRLYELGPHAPADRVSSLVLDVLGDIADRVRQHGPAGVTSTPAMIAALLQARGLSALRGRERPGRSDVVDAAISCFVQGDISTEGLPILAAVREVLTGDRLGSVPPGTGRPPIAEDFDEECRRLRLPTDTTTPTRVELDRYRRAEHQAKSRFLHRTAYLGIPFATWIAGPQFGSGAGMHLIRETWRCQLTPATDVGLVEAGRFGPTITGAVIERFVAETDTLDDGEASAANVARHLARGAELGVHDAIPRVVEQLQRQASLDPSLASVASALTELELLRSSRRLLEGGRMQPLEGLMTQLYVRACFLVGMVGDLTGSDVELAGRALLELRDAVVAAGPDICDATLFWSEIDRLDQRRIHPEVAGICAGLLWTARMRTDAEIVLLVRGHLLGGVDNRAIDAFLRGLLASAKEIVWQVDGITAILSEQLEQWGQREFLERLPGLRSAFAMLTPRETDRVAQLVGSHAPTVVTDLDEASLLANLESDARIADLLRADGVTWVGGR